MTLMAAIQLCASQHVDDNLAVAAQLIDEAAKQGAKLIVLPEMFPLIGLQETAKLGIKEPFGQGKIQSFLAHQAKLHQIWLVGGTIPIACETPNKVRAACLVFNERGELAARYDKMHLFDVIVSATERHTESNTVEPGNQIVVVETPFGKLGLAVCYDVRFPELFRCLFNQGAEIIALPSAFTARTGAAHWEVLLRSRAIENFCYVIGAAQGGIHDNGRETYGHTQIIHPWGNILAKLPGEETGVICAPIDLKALHAIRNAIPVDQHQRIFFDTSKLRI